MIEPDAPPSALISGRDILETVLGLTSAALFGAFIAMIENWW